MKILNLAGKLSGNMRSYFEHRKVTFLSGPSEEFDFFIASPSTAWSEILEYAQLAPMLYLGSVEPKEELLSKCNFLELREEHLLTNYGQYLVSRFLSQSPSCHVDEDLHRDFPAQSRFHMASLFVTGIYYDEVYGVFHSHGFDANASRVFLNNVIVLISSLKLGFDNPIALSFSVADKAAYVNLSIELNSEPESIECDVDLLRKTADKLSLNSNFTEVSFVEDSRRINILSIWDKNSRVIPSLSFINLEKLVNRLKHLDYQADLNSYLVNQLESIDPEEETEWLTDIKDEDLSLDESSGANLAPDNSSDQTQQVSLELDEELTSASPRPQLKKLDEEFVQRLSSTSTEEFIQKVSSSFEEGLESELQRVSASGEDSISLEKLLVTVFASANKQEVLKANFKEELSQMSSQQIIETVFSIIKSQKSDSQESREKETQLKEKLLHREQELTSLKNDRIRESKAFEIENRKLKAALDSKDMIIQKAKQTIESVIRYKDKEIEKYKNSPEGSRSRPGQKGTEKDYILEDENARLKSAIAEYKSQLKTMELTVKRSNNSKQQNKSALREKRLEAGFKKAKLELEKQKQDNTRVKRELHKLKQENMVLQNQMRSNANKKAS